MTNAASAQPSAEDSVSGGPDSRPPLDDGIPIDEDLNGSFQPDSTSGTAAASGPEPDLRGDAFFPDGEIRTGAGYHSLTGRIERTVVDLRVPGSVGEYPLTITRTMRNWVTNATSNPTVPNWNQEAGCSARWAFHLSGYGARLVDWGYTGDQGIYLQYPDGTEARLTQGTGAGVYTVGEGDRVYVTANKKITHAKLRDGGTVYFRDNNDPNQRYWGTDRIVDRHGLVTTLTTGPGELRLTDASGRWVRLVFDGQGPTRAEASTGEFVDYVWDYSSPTGLRVPVNTAKLLEARYSDGTVARYEYVSNTHGVFPFRCFDTRATSHMHSVEYRFNQGQAFWRDVYDGLALGLFPLIDERLPGATTPLSTRTQYDFGNGRAVRETRGDGATRNVVPASAATTGGGLWVYSATDFTGNQTSRRFGRSTSNVPFELITDPLGRQTQFDYAGVDGYPLAGSGVIKTPIRVTHPDGSFKRFVYTDLNNPYYVRQTIDELGRTTTYDRHPNNVISQITHPDGSTEAWGSLNAFNQPGTYRRRNGATEAMTYDSMGRLLRHSNPYTSSASAYVTYTYYPAGHVWADRVKTVTDQRGNVTTFEYDLKFVNNAQSTTPCAGRGLVTKIVNPDNSARMFVYDVYGNKIAETNELGHTTRYAYDDYNRLTKVTDAAGGETLYAYGDTTAQALAHTANAPRRITTPAGRKTAWLYDADKRPTLKVEAEGSSDAHYVRYEYDAVGNLKRLREQIGGTAGSGSETYRDTSYDYDNRNRRITQYAPLGRTTDWGYDAVGNNTWMRYADASVTSKDYDSMNRVLRETDEMGRVTTYTYFASGKINSITDPRSKTYSYTYDTADRVKQFRLSNAAGTGYDYEESTYDAAGNLTKFRNRSGSSKTLTYDSRNREKSTTWSDGSPGTTTTYDVASRVVTKTNSVSALSYTYDALNRTLTETQAISGFPAKTVTYTYDADGNRLSLYFTGGYGIRYEHNSRSQVAKVNWWNSVNAATYTYRPDGLRKKRTLENASATDYDYDAAGRPVLVHHYATASGSWIEKQQYGYDLRDRRTWTRRNDDLGDTYAYQLDGQLTDFRFNANNPNGTPTTWASRNTFNYDAAGNRTTVVSNGATLTYATNSANRYTSITGITIQHSDGRGNTTKLRDWTYAYDAENRMKSASRTGTSATFAYDPAGRLVKRTIGGAVEYLIYDGPQIVLRHDSADTLQGWVVWGPNPDEPLVDYTPSAGKHYFHSDVQGNTITVTDGSLNTLERYRYDAYGNVTFWAWSGAQRPQSTAGTKYLFTGQEYVAALGFYNYKNRVYSAEIGRFLQSDPLRLDAGDLNLYRYCRNNPFNLTDPLGLAEKAGANGLSDAEAPDDVFRRVTNWLGALGSRSAASNSGARAQGPLKSALADLDRATGGPEYRAGLSAARTWARDQLPAAVVEAMDSFSAIVSETGGVGLGVPVGAASPAMLRGLAAESRVLQEMGLAKNASALATQEGRAIPDSLTRLQLFEVKDRASISLTRQLRIETQAAAETGRQSVLITGSNTHVSGPATKAFDQIIRLRDLGPK